jgi:hypothetical protein
MPRRTQRRVADSTATWTGHAITGSRSSTKKPLINTATQHDRDRRWAMGMGIAVVILTLIPYLIGWSMAGGRIYMWLGYNLDDSCVYLSWMRQAQEGAFRGYNLFTTEPQHGMALNPLFWLLGNVARFTGLSLLAIYQGSRLLLGLVLLTVVWRLIEQLTVDRLARKIAFLFVCFSAGLGWLPLWWQDGGPINPIDRWQPEAITFLSLYLSPLFCASMALQVGIVLLLLRADRTQRLRPAVAAGLCGFMLGLIHTYDVLSLAAVWLTYLAVNTLRPIAGTSRPALLWRNALVAGAITLPAVLYIVNALRTEIIFRQRAAVPTLSPVITSVLVGYGVTLIIALIAVYRMTKPQPLPVDGDPPALSVAGVSCGLDAARLLVAWAVANLLVSYLPTTFQRKLLQGEHFPIAILAGLGAAWLFSRLRLESWRLWVAVAGLTLFLSITNIRFLLRDLDNDAINLAQTRQHRPYLKPGEIEALHWFDTHVPHDIAIQPLPYLARSQPDERGHTSFWPTDMSVACFAPGLTGHHVYCGHWGETPHYIGADGKLFKLDDFALPTTTDAQRIALLKQMKVGFLLYSQKDENDDSADHLAPMFRGRAALPDYLRLVHSNSDADVYEVDPKIFPQNGALSL